MASADSMRTFNAWVLPWDGRSHRLGGWALPYFQEARLLICESAPPPVEALGSPLDVPWVEVPREAPQLASMLRVYGRVLWLAAVPARVVRRLRQVGAVDVAVLDVPEEVAPAAVAEGWVLVTRPWPEAWEMSEALETRGIPAVPFPTIAFEAGDAPPDAWIQAPEAFTWVVLTSARGVDFLRAWTEAHGWRPDRLRSLRWAAIGPATAERLRAWGFEPDLTPPDVYQAEGLIEAFRDVDVAGRRVLLARAEGRPVLTEALRSMGAEVWEWRLYRTVAYPADRLRRLLPWLERTRWVTFTSPSTFRSFFNFLRSVYSPEAVARWPETHRIVVIGPVTAEAVRQAGWPVHIQAEQATQAALVEVIADLWGPTGGL
jgi:uroporphyrinogen-III synthase